MARRVIRNPHVERWGLRAKTASDWLVAKAVGALLWTVRLLPARAATETMAWLGYRLAPVLPRTKMAKRNLALAFPEKSSEEIDRLAREVWGHVARTVAEYVYLDDLFEIDLDHPERGRVEVSGIETFLRVRDAGRPAILFTAHTGNWEILPIGAMAYGLEVTALFRMPNNRFLAEKVMAARQTEKGHLVPSRAGAAWALDRTLSDGRHVGLLVDQGFRKGVPIEFLGRKAMANPLAAKLARQHDCDIHPARCVRLPGGRFRVEIEPALDLPRADDGRIDVPQTTKRINAVIERWVREHPAQWLWLHDRWKMPRGPQMRPYERKPLQR